MTRAAVFDLDGTLADTIADIARPVNAALARRGLPVHGIGDYKLLVGNGFANLARLALPEGLRGDALAEELRAEAQAAYEAAPLVDTRPYEGVREVLETLRGRGIALAVLSNKPEALARLVVASLFPGLGFRAVLGDLPGRPRKPDPGALLGILAGLGVDPAEAVLVGDSDVDMLTARNAGLRGLGAGWGFRGEAELLAAGACAVAARPGDIPALVGEGPLRETGRGR